MKNVDRSVIIESTCLHKVVFIKSRGLQIFDELASTKHSIILENFLYSRVLQLESLVNFIMTFETHFVDCSKL